MKPIADFPLVAAAAMTALLLCAPARTVKAQTLTDTGQVNCYNASAQTGTVSTATPTGTISDATFLRQDCTRGAAAADAMGAMSKQGGSSVKGFDYTKIANDGSELPASATLGSGAGDWACTRDNLTGLIWEVKVSNLAHLRYQNHRYTWYDTNTAINGGNAGTLGTATTCNNTLGNCNTTAFRDAVNAAGLCGANDWRLPTQFELQSLSDYSNAGTAYDVTWFPNTANSAYWWTGVNYASNASGAWVVYFSNGVLNAGYKANYGYVRLVRGGQ